MSKPQEVVRDCVDDVKYDGYFVFGLNRHDVHITQDDLDEIDLTEDLKRGVYSHGIEHFSPIQKMGIPIFLHRKRLDLIVESHTGMGKATMAMISLIQILEEDPERKKNEIQCLFLVPSRDKAEMYSKDFCFLSGYTDLKSICVVGGKSVENDVKEIRDTCPNVIFGTVGRVNHYIKKKIISIDNLSLVIMYECEMAYGYYGLKNELEEILESLPKKESEDIPSYENKRNKVQIGLFSHAIDGAFEKFFLKYMNKPVRILLQPNLFNSMQFYVNVVEEKNKFDHLLGLLNSLPGREAILYCNSIQKALVLSERLRIECHERVSTILSTDSISNQNETLREFDEGRFRFLVVSNYIKSESGCLGGDLFSGKYFCVNYDVEKWKRKKEHLFRVGKIGRFGKKYVSINFAKLEDIPVLKMFGKQYNFYVSILPLDFQDYIGVSKTNPKPFWRLWKEKFQEGLKMSISDLKNRIRFLMVEEYSSSKEEKEKNEIIKVIIGNSQSFSIPKLLFL